MDKYLDLKVHNFTAQSEIGTVGRFSNLDLAVRSARDFSFYRGVLEFPDQSRLNVYIFDNTTGSIYDQKFIDNRFQYLLSLDEQN
jgi:hypothetical protein